MLNSVKILVCPYIIFCNFLFDILVDRESDDALMRILIFHPNKKNNAHFQLIKAIHIDNGCDDFQLIKVTQIFFLRDTPLCHMICPAYKLKCKNYPVWT
jgi:hypothetical protein